MYQNLAEFVRTNGGPEGYVLHIPPCVSSNVFLVCYNAPPLSLFGYFQRTKKNTNIAAKMAKRKADATDIDTTPLKKHSCKSNSELRGNA